MSGMLTLQATPALARQWVTIWSNSRATGEVDVDSIRGTGDSRTFWQRIVFFEDQSYGYRRHRSSTMLMYVNCTTQQIGALRAVYHDHYGEVVDSFDQSYLTVPTNLTTVIPDTNGDATLRYICERRRPNGGFSTTSLQTSARNGGAITREQARNLVNRWLQAKREIFAPPYSRQRIEELTTGNLRQELLSDNGPVAFLRRNNAWYEYGAQGIEETRMFSADQSGAAIIEVRVGEYITYFENGQLNTRASGWKTTTVRYYLRRTNGQLKISGISVVQPST
ncbi:MAG: ARC6/PARC6 family protein [Cyanobacteria bacterium]|nr:ARC6/PARC6 family protein [Cyanobacteriota bacterium]MDW8199598.1 ARC6/PARC6 family protein [Cyanobacteriota bacterium SKYGB_h_bin112]